MKYSLIFAAAIVTVVSATADYSTPTNDYSTTCPTGTVKSAKGPCICAAGSSYDGSQCQCTDVSQCYLVGSDNKGSCGCGGDFVANDCTNWTPPTTDSTSGSYSAPSDTSSGSYSAPSGSYSKRGDYTTPAAATCPSCICDASLYLQASGNTCVCQDGYSRPDGCPPGTACTATASTSTTSTTSTDEDCDESGQSGKDHDHDHKGHPHPHPNKGKDNDKDHGKDHGKGSKGYSGSSGTGSYSAPSNDYSNTAPTDSTDTTDYSNTSTDNSDYTAPSTSDNGYVAPSTSDNGYVAPASK